MTGTFIEQFDRMEDTLHQHEREIAYLRRKLKIAEARWALYEHQIISLNLRILLQEARHTVARRAGYRSWEHFYWKYRRHPEYLRYRVEKAVRSKLKWPVHAMTVDILCTDPHKTILKGNRAAHDLRPERVLECIAHMMVVEEVQDAFYQIYELGY